MFTFLPHVLKSIHLIMMAVQRLKLVCRHQQLQSWKNSARVNQYSPCLPRKHLTTKVANTDDYESRSSPWQHEATLYVHWPYCQRRCTYCNFNKYIDRSTDHQRMRNCLLTETATLLKLSGVGKIKSIFFGGGTPSLALPSTFHDVIETVAQSVELDEDAEITMEANPTSIETGKMKEFKQAGINRISLGIQALNDADLKLLGRDHNAAESLKSVTEAKHLFPGRVSLDLIFGRPGQSMSSWQQELKEVLRLCDDHVSLYQLTLERGTALFKLHEQGKITLPDGDLMAEMYEGAVNMLENAGFVRYEVSNFARNGAESKHNQAYWLGSQYIGVGPGAHGRFVCKSENEESDRILEARIQTLEPIPWMREVELIGHGTRKRVQLSQKEKLEELIMLGLRTHHGIYEKNWEVFSKHQTLQDIFQNSSTFLKFVKQGYLCIDGNGLRTTRKGMSVLDSILPELLLVLHENIN